MFTCAILAGLGLSRRRERLTVETVTAEDPTEGYGIFPKWVLGKVSMRGLALFTVLTVHANKHGICWPSVSTIAHEMGASKDTVTRATKELQEIGLLHVEKRKSRDGKRHLSNIYQIRLYDPGSPEWGAPLEWYVDKEEDACGKEFAGTRNLRPPYPQFAATLPANLGRRITKRELPREKEEGYVRDTREESVDNVAAVADLSSRSEIVGAASPLPTAGNLALAEVPKFVPASLETEQSPAYNPTPLKVVEDVPVVPVGDPGGNVFHCVRHRHVVNPPACRECGEARKREQDRLQAEAEAREKERRAQPLCECHLDTRLGLDGVCRKCEVDHRIPDSAHDPEACRLCREGVPVAVASRADSIGFRGNQRVPGGPVGSWRDRLTARLRM